MSDAVLLMRDAALAANDNERGFRGSRLHGRAP